MVKCLCVYTRIAKSQVLQLWITSVIIRWLHSIHTHLPVGGLPLAPERADLVAQRHLVHPRVWLIMRVVVLSEHKPDVIGELKMVSIFAGLVGVLDEQEWTQLPQQSLHELDRVYWGTIRQHNGRVWRYGGRIDVLQARGVALPVREVAQDVVADVVLLPWVAVVVDD